MMHRLRIINRNQRNPRHILFLPHQHHVPFTSTPTKIQYDPNTGIITLNNLPHYQTIIGLEIHAQLSSPVKLFSSSSTTTKTSKPNTLLHYHDIAYPGHLPVLSGPPLRQAILTAHALRCQIHRTSRFERKHYFYPDLPHGYQITQQRWPLGTDGTLHCHANLDVGIERVQLEMDTGKQHHHFLDKTNTVLDYNRAGCALVEIVFRPELRAARDAGGVVSMVQSLLKRIGTCDGKMEEGNLRVDVNVSIAPLVEEDDDEDDRGLRMGKEGWMLPKNTGGRVEIKNLNSMRQVVSSIQYEAKRQTQIMISSPHSKIERETRTYDVASRRTVLLRRKETEVDYRFMPEPNLPPLVLNQQSLNGQTLEEILQTIHPIEVQNFEKQTIRQLQSQYHLSTSLSTILTTSEYPPGHWCIPLFERAFDILQTSNTNNEHENDVLATMVANWICNDLFKLIKHHPIERLEEDATYSHVNGETLGRLLLLLHQNIITTPTAKRVLKLLHTTPDSDDPDSIVRKRNWGMITDSKRLQTLCREVVFEERFEKQREEYKRGGTKVRKLEQFFVGKVMQHCCGNAHPDLVMEALREVLRELLL